MTLRALLSFSILSILTAACGDSGDGGNGGSGGGGGEGGSNANPDATEEVSADSGGTVTDSDHAVTLEIPAGALAEDTVVSLFIQLRTARLDLTLI
jgi:hypothetical protein